MYYSSYYYFDEVHVIPNANITSSSLNACLNNKVTYTTESGMSNYLWTISSGGTVTSGGGTNDPTITVNWNTTGSHTITVSYSNNGCITSGTYNVNVLPSPQIPTITGPNNDCILTDNYTFSNSGVNYISYLWNISPTSFGTINGTNASPNVNISWNAGLITNSNPGNLNLTVTDGNGCSITATYNIYSCCNNADYINLDDPNIIYTAGNIPTNSDPLFINGTINLSGSITIFNKTVYLGPNAGINLLPNSTLNIDNNSVFTCRYKGCYNMWDGIYTSDNTTRLFVSNGSTIEDAINGLVSENGGIIYLLSTNPSVPSNNVKMLDNLFNVKIINNGTSITYPGSITNTVFSNDNSGNNYLLQYPPYMNAKTLVGIYCNNSHNFTIGNDGDVNYRNTFENMRFGIYSYNSDINVYNNQFTNIENGTSPLPPFPILSSYSEGAIFAFNDINDYYNLKTINVGGSNLKRNYFEKCNTGIFTYQYVNNLINNDFNDCYDGIDLVRISNTFVKNNSITTTLGNPIIGNGIAISNTHPTPHNIGVNCTVDLNDIVNKQVGIRLLCVNSTDISHSIVTNNTINNFISLSSPPILQFHEQIGITAYYCEGIYVALNLVKRNFPMSFNQTDYNNIRGVWMSDCQNAYVFQNHLINMGNGIYTTGFLNNTKFDCNRLDGNYYGFRFGPTTFNMSNQGVSGGYNPYNEWNFDNTTFKRMVDNGLNGSFIYFYYPQFSNYDPNFSINAPPVQTILNPGGISKCNNTPTGGNTDPLGYGLYIGTLDAREAELGQIVRDEKIYNYLEEQCRETDREYVFEMLKKDPTIMYMGGSDDNIYMQFYQDELNSDIGKIQQMQDELTNNNIELARQMLSQVIGDDVINNNRKIVDNIYLDTWASNIYDFTDDQYNTLYSIASLTPYAGGDAVYTARVMLHLDPSELNLLYTKPPVHNQQNITENTVKVYPNPANKQFTIEFKDVISGNAIVEVYGIMGNLVLTDNLQGVYIKNIDVSKLNDGLYFYKISMNGTNVSTGKLTILNK